VFQKYFRREHQFFDYRHSIMSHDIYIPHPLALRYERKYRIEQMPAHLVEQIVRMHPASFQKSFPDRQVNNVYFDTSTFTTFHENQSGIAQRKKYRVRWYGPFMQILEHPVLEVKVKDNLLGYKESHPIPNATLQNLDELKAVVNQQLNTHQALQAVLLNSYQRSYWVTPNQKIRLTIDWDLSFHQLFKHPQFSKFLLKDKAVIVELKYAEDQETAASRIMQHLPFRLTKQSKYVEGVEM